MRTLLKKNSISIKIPQHNRYLFIGNIRTDFFKQNGKNLLILILGSEIKLEDGTLTF